MQTDSAKKNLKSNRSYKIMVGVSDFKTIEKVRQHKKSPERISFEQKVKEIKSFPTFSTDHQTFWLTTSMNILFATFQAVLKSHCTTNY